MENVKSGTIMENIKSEDLVTSDWLEKFGVEKFIFERLYNAKGSKEIEIEYCSREPYDIRIGNGEDDNLFYNKNTYELYWFSNGLLYLQEECEFNNALILDKQGNVVYEFDNYDVFERFDLSIPIKVIWEARDNREIKWYDFLGNYERSQGYEFHVHDH